MPVAARAALRRALPAALLVAVALAQIALARHAALSPWLGGGFGMFASTDGWGRREVRAVALREGMRRPLAPMRDAPAASRRAAALPSEAHLRALARELAGLPGRDEAPLRAIELEICGVRFERDTLEPRPFRLRALTVPVTDLIDAD
jgi:hypothetical protein